MSIKISSFLYCIHSITYKRQNVNSFFEKVTNSSVCVIGARALFTTLKR
nr:MAG TPA: hypothetical protein [Herelleviridae sp.]